jgi:hypothetical protein
MSSQKSFRYGVTRRVIIASLAQMSGVTPTSTPSTNANSIYKLCNLNANDVLRLVGVKISGQVGVTGGGNRGAINISSDGGITNIEYCAAGADFVEDSTNVANLVIGGDAGAVVNVCIILKFTN